jgi:PAS domain S-box-containing protein
MNIDTIPASTDGQRSQDRPAAVAPASILHGGPINILIVDDEPKNLTVLETVLDNPDYRLVRAESADQALLALVDEEFALLILDIRMPGMTGFELAQLIKERKKTSRVPIIFLTAYYNEDQHILEGYGAGAVDYLHKPVNPAILRSKVAVFAELHRKSRESGVANRALLAEVTERRRAEEQLRELNDTLDRRVTERTEALLVTSAALNETGERYRSLFDSSLDAIFFLGADERFEAANPSALRLTAYTLDELKTLRFLDLCVSDQREAVENAFRTAFRRQCLTVDTTIITSTGERRDLFISAAPAMVQDKVVGISCIARDITERKQAQEAMQQSEARLDGIISSAMDAIITIDVTQCVTDFNKSAEQMFRCATADAVGQPIDRFIPKRSWSMHGSHIEAIDNTHVTKDQMGALGTIIGLRADGDEFPIEASISQFRTHAGQFYTVILRDITKRKQAEEALRQNEVLFSALVDQAPNGMYVVDTQFRMRQVNSRALPVFGDVHPLIGRDFSEVIQILWGPELGGQVADIFRHTLETGERYFSPTFTKRRADLGVEQSYEWETQRITLPDGKHGVVCYFTDITQRKHAERAMAHLAAIVMSSNDAIIGKDLQGIVTSWNGGAEHLFGYTANEMIGQPVLRLIPPERHAEESHILERIGRGESIEHYETIRRRKDGTDFHISLTISPLIDAQGKVIGASKIARDITERKYAEETLRDRDRALAHELSERKQIEDRLRRLAGTLEERVKERTQELAKSYGRLRALATDLTVAEQMERRRLATELHDYLAQMLVVTRMKISQLLRQDHDPDVRTILQDADELLHQSLDYTRSLVSELTPQALYERGLGAALRWLADQMRRQQMLTVEISLDAPELPLPEEDAVLLFHSIRELLFNVLKHGKTDRASVSMCYVQNVLSITVSDHGCGFDVSRMSDDRSDRFGLLSIRERMTALGGNFDLQSEPGKGTVASLHLPFTASGEGIETQVAAAPRRTHGPGLAPPSFGESNVVTPLRVLIVDDHQMVREAMCGILEEYDDLTVVGEASTGEQALQLAGTLMPEVVIMDMHMPGWNGAESTRRILKEYPSTVVIGLSIQTDPQIAESMLDAGAVAFLPKEAIGNELYSTIQTAVHRMTSSRSVTSRPSA